MNAPKYSPFVAESLARTATLVLALVSCAPGCQAEPSQPHPGQNKPGAPALAQNAGPGAGPVAPAFPAASPPGPRGPEIAPGVFEIGHLNHPRLTECSGVVASRQFPDTFWVHNDGGGAKRQVLYAVTRTGQPKAEFHVFTTLITDWEDIAIDDARQLYLGDIGNNDASRHELAVHRVDEPNPAAGTRGAELQVKQTWRLRFPGERFDSESLFIWKDHGYLVSKVSNNARAEIYRFPLAPATQPVTLEFVARTRIESPVAGADLSPDGRRLALIAKSGAFLIPVEGDLSRAHKEKGYQTRFRHDRTEGCTFVPDGLLVTAESRQVFLFTDPPFRGE